MLNTSVNKARKPLPYFRRNWVQQYRDKNLDDAYPRHCEVSIRTKGWIDSRRDWHTFGVLST